MKYLLIIIVSFYIVFFIFPEIQLLYLKLKVKIQRNKNFREKLDKFIELKKKEKD
jgi:hypothetical protein